MSGTHAASGPARSVTSMEQRVEGTAWDRILTDLDATGIAVIEGLLGREECGELTSLYPDESLFRKHVVMARHGYGRGEYKYFAYPLPGLIGCLRTVTYPHLARLANRWNAELGLEVRYPAKHSDFLKRCHKAGQVRPTPLLLNMARAISTACIRISMGNTPFRCKWRFFCRSPARTSAAGSSSSPSNGPACSRGPRSCLCARAMP